MFSNFSDTAAALWARKVESYSNYNIDNRLELLHVIFEQLYYYQSILTLMANCGSSISSHGSDVGTSSIGIPTLSYSSLSVYRSNI